MLLLLVVATACGSRLTDEQCEFAMRAYASGDAGVGVETGDHGNDGDGVMPQGADGAANQPADDESRPDAPVPTTVHGGASSAESAPGIESTPTGQLPAVGPQRDQPRDIRAAPPGGKGGATDTGITEDRITIANVSDISGPVPGLFRETQLAVQAYARDVQRHGGHPIRSPAPRAPSRHPVEHRRQPQPVHPCM